MAKVIIEYEYIQDIVTNGNWDINEIEHSLTQLGYDGDYYITGGSNDRLFACNPQKYYDTITITADDIRLGLWIVCEHCGKEINIEEPHTIYCPYCGEEFGD